MKSIKFLIVGIATLVMVGGCSQKSQIEKTLKDNPDVLFNVIKAHPKKFLATVNEVMQKAREGAAQDEAKADDARIDADLKSPKKPVIDEKRPIFGNPKAPITIVEYSDFQCPFCGRAYVTVEKVMKQYGDKVRLFYKNLPLSIHKMAMPAAQYYEAIAMQSNSKAKKFHDIVFQHQDELVNKEDAFLKATARKVGANMAKLSKDIHSDAVKKRIEEDSKEAEKFGFTGTPGFLINGVRIPGAYPESEFQKIIDRELKGKG